MTSDSTPKTPYQHIHLVGVGGIGLSRLAKYFLTQKREVTGSDLVESAITNDLISHGLKFFQGHQADNLPQNCDLLIYSAAVSESSPERAEALKRGVPQMSHFEVLGKISENFKTIAIAGTNGKSTTTAMIGLILEEAKLDPTVFVGSKVKEWGGNLRIGKGKYLVVEADELYRQFLHLAPYGLVITNIEADHMDYYKDLADLRSAFQNLAKKLPADGFFSYNADDEGSMEVGQFVRLARVGDYGRQGSRIKLMGVKRAAQTQQVEVSLKGKKEKFALKVPGLFNVYNALAAISVALELNIPFSVCRTALEDFHGIWRRFEILGTLGKTVVISDYAHHPTALLYTVLAAKEFYPGKRIFLAFQPHQYQRTKIFFQEFLHSLVSSKPDCLLIAEVFDVAGRESREKKVTGRDLALEASKRLPDVLYAPNLKVAEEEIKKRLDQYDVLLVIGAGDIYQIAENLFAEKQT